MVGTSITYLRVLRLATPLSSRRHCTWLDQLLSFRFRETACHFGAEGGWSDDELDLLEHHGAKPVSLGPRVLRTETAAVVAITLIQHLTGDLSARGNE